MLRHQERDRASGVFRHAQHHRQVFHHRVVVEHELQVARPRRAHGVRDRRQFVLARLQGRREVAGRGAMVDRARGGEAERAGADRLRGNRRHRLAVLGRRGLAPRAAIVHHIDAHRRVRQQRADVDVIGALRQPVDEVREALPLPGDAGRQAPAPECPRPPPSARSGGCGPRDGTAQSRRRNCP